MRRPIVCGWVAVALALSAGRATVAAAADEPAVDCTSANREMARTWTMHRIAVIQAEAGDVLGAKKTAWQIVAPGEPSPATVIGVWFCQGRPLYCLPPPMCPPSAPCAMPRPPVPAVDHVPAQAPAGLPADYLQADPRHGAVVDFAEDVDSHGTRVTMRKYADGAAVIETPGKP